MFPQVDLSTYKLNLKMYLKYINGRYYKKNKRLKNVYITK